MASQRRDASRLTPRPSTYPRLSSSTVTALNEKLVDVVRLLHQDKLTDAQVRELTGAIGNQIANVEKLHQFSLTNADEPAFAVVTNRAADHD